MMMFVIVTGDSERLSGADVDADVWALGN
jgi:hypothetical protein